MFHWKILPHLQYIYKCREGWYFEILYPPPFCEMGMVVLLHKKSITCQYLPPETDLASSVCVNGLQHAAHMHSPRCHGAGGVKSVLFSLSGLCCWWHLTHSGTVVCPWAGLLEQAGPIVSVSLLQWKRHSRLWEQRRVTFTFTVTSNAHMLEKGSQNTWVMLLMNGNVQTNAFV